MITNKIGIIIYITFMFLAAHIFILPNDILDKFPSLVSYTEFMKETFPVVYQISIRVTNFPQSGTLWAANMVALTTIFIPIFGCDTYLRIQISGFLKNINLITLILLVAFCIIFIFVILESLSMGNIFDTQLRGDPNPNSINNKFGLFFKAGLFYMTVSVFLGGIMSYILIIFKKIKQKIKGLDNEK